MSIEKNLERIAQSLEIIAQYVSNPVTTELIQGECTGCTAKPSGTVHGSHNVHEDIKETKDDPTVQPTVPGPTEKIVTPPALQESSILVSESTDNPIAAGMAVATKNTEQALQPQDYSKLDRGDLVKICNIRNINVKPRVKSTTLIKELEKWDNENVTNPTPVPGIPAAEGAEIQNDTPADTVPVETGSTPPVTVQPSPVANPTSAGQVIQTPAPVSVGTPPAVPMPAAQAATQSPPAPTPAAATIQPAAPIAPAPVANAVPADALDISHVVSKTSALINSYHSNDPTGRMKVTEILQEHGGGVAVIGSLKPEYFGMVYAHLCTAIEMRGAEIKRMQAGA